MYFWGWNKKQVYYKHLYGMKGINYVKYDLIDDADGRSFVVLKENLGMDKHHVFYATIKQDQMDRPSFYLNQYGVECDKNGAYTLRYDKTKKKEYFKLIEGADPRSFRYLETKIYNRAAISKIAQDDYTVFVTKPMPHEYQKTSMHSPSFRILNRHFAVDKDSVYLFLKDEIAAIPLAEGKLEPMGSYLWNNNVIYAVGESAKNWRVIPVKDPHSVKPGYDVEESNSRFGGGVASYLLIDQVLYLWDEVCQTKGVSPEDLDFDNFTEIEGVYGAFKDQNRVYQYSKSLQLLEVVPGADGSTFEKVGTLFGVFRDKNQVYYYNSKEILPKEVADAATFAPLESHGRMYQDKEYLYFYNRSFLAQIKGGMDLGSLHAYPAENFVFDKYGVFFDSADGERQPHPFGEINSKEVIKNIRKFARENRPRE